MEGDDREDEGTNGPNFPFYWCFGNRWLCPLAIKISHLTDLRSRKAEGIFFVRKIVVSGDFPFLQMQEKTGWFSGIRKLDQTTSEQNYHGQSF